MTGFALLPTAPEDGPEQHDQNFKGVSRILGPKWAQLPAITVGLLGVQMFWSVETSCAPPYLLTLGLSKSSTAVVFIAGPLSGLIMQPLIGVLADNCTSRFGRRRPYILLGSVICAFAMLLLGFSGPVASIFTVSDSHSNNLITTWLAIFAIYLIDFSINAVQAVDRALLVDTIPSSEQASGNAWAGRMLGIGGVIGFFVGNIDLPHWLPFLGKTQLQVLSVLASLLLLAVHLLVAGLVKERVLVQNTSVYRKSFPQEVKDLWDNLFTLPKVIRQIFIIQFLYVLLGSMAHSVRILRCSSAWIAWFPVLFYSTTYVGDLYKRSVPAATTDEDQNLIDEKATRLGSRALFYFALLSLIVSVVLPAFVAEAAGHPSQNQSSSWWQRVCRVPRVMQVHLVTVWAASQLVFAGCMFATLFTHSVWGSTFIITVTGFSWAITQWAPFALLGEAILTEPTTIDEIRLADARIWPQRQQGFQTSEEQGERDVFLDHDSEDEDEDGDEEARSKDRRQVIGDFGAQLSRVNLSDGVVDVQDEEYEFIPGGQETNGRANGVSRSDRAVSLTLSSKAGVILGIHNIFIVIPQFLSAGFAAVLFAIVDPKKPLFPDHRAPIAPGPSLNGTISIAAANAVVSGGKKILESMLLDNSTQGKDELNDLPRYDSLVYIFCIGGVAACLAFVLSWRLATEIRHR